MALFSKGIVLEQHKEPALSREFISLTDEETSPLTFTPPQFEGEPDFEQLVDIAERAMIIDERDGRPLAEKLLAASKKQLFAVVADAVDDEPYVSSQLGVVLHNREKVAYALRLCASALGVQKYCILIYKNMTDLTIKLPNRIDSVNVLHIFGKYPAENRAENLFGPSQKKLIIGVGALLHLYRAVKESRVQTTCFITVAGNCIANSRNVEVTIGKTAGEVLGLCGLALDPTRIVLGGSMTGRSITDLDEPVGVTTRAVLAFEDASVRRQYHCIGCGQCVDACPQGLMPSLIYRYVDSGRYDGLELLDPTHCIECSTCTYICPSELEVSAHVARAKRYLLSTQQERCLEEEKLRQSSRTALKEAVQDFSDAAVRVGAAVSGAAKKLSGQAKSRRKQPGDAKKEKEKVSSGS